MNFNELPWHDSVVKSINIDRSSPGFIDEIVVYILWPDKKKNERIVFKNVYYANLDLNFGFEGEESVLNAFELPVNDPCISKLYSKWRGLIDDVVLKGFKIQLNTSGSEILVISSDFKVL